MATAEMTAPKTEGFQMPAVYPGCQVMISRNPNMTKAAFGHCVEGALSSIVAYTVTRKQIGYWTACWHKDDPRLKDQDKLATFLGDTTHGIWELAEYEKQHRMLIERVNTLTQTMESLMQTPRQPLSGAKADMAAELRTLAKSLAETDRHVAALSAKMKDK